MSKQVNLTGRKSRCSYFGHRATGRNGNGEICKDEVNSIDSLPFFKHKPDSKYDEHYCGCWGWD